MEIEKEKQLTEQETELLDNLSKIGDYTHLRIVLGDINKEEYFFGFLKALVNLIKQDKLEHIKSLRLFEKDEDNVKIFFNNSSLCRCY